MFEIIGSVLWYAFAVISALVLLALFLAPIVALLMPKKVKNQRVKK